MMVIKNEKLFAWFAEKEADGFSCELCTQPQHYKDIVCKKCQDHKQMLQCKPTNLGRKQFFEEQSYGIKPDNPDMYYQKLNRGKWGFDFIHEEYHKIRYTYDWPGTHSLKQYWENDLWVLEKLLK